MPPEWNGGQTLGEARHGDDGGIVLLHVGPQDIPMHGCGAGLDMADVRDLTANTEANLRDISFTGDVIFVHDPQPAGLIPRKGEIARNRVWRCQRGASLVHPIQTVSNHLWRSR